jgi:hypothetical protein
VHVLLKTQARGYAELLKLFPHLQNKDYIEVKIKQPLPKAQTKALHEKIS